MTQADFGVALALFIVTLIFVVVQRIELRKQQRRVLRYPLFRVRHNLVCLVANKTIAERDPAFKFLYEGVNELIPQIKPLSLRAIVSALRNSSLLNQEIFRQFLADLANRDPAVSQAAVNLFSTLDQILFNSSFLVRRAGKKSRPLAIGILAHLFHTQIEAYRLHQATREIREELSAVQLTPASTVS